ncbi:cytochrome P450 [Trametes polyzona]|nr:cytochrome P450 [Trametes polyzona]
MESLNTTRLAIDILCISLAAIALAYIRSVMNRKSGTLRLPPGPRRLPFVGNLFSIPRWKPWLGFSDISDRYGDVAYLEVFGRSILVLGSSEVIFELLEKRAANTSDRPLSPLVELAAQDFNFTMMPYGQLWRRHRRALWQHFNARTAEGFRPIQRAYALKYLNELLDRPAGLRELIPLNVAGAIIKVAYGVDIRDDKDELLGVVDDAFIGLRELTVSAQAMLEMFPFIRYLPPWFPGAGFMKSMGRSQAACHRLLFTEFDESVAKMQENPEHTSLVSSLLARMASSSEKEGTASPVSEQIARNVTGIAVEGGSDTILSTMEGLFLGLACNREVQEKAQAELDRVVGTDRLPDFADHDKLVYINAIIKEGYRWHNVTPLGAAHKTVHDDEFRGFFIPAGTTVVGNVWRCAHDARIFPEPERFNPDRFMRNGRLNTEVLDPAFLTFGWGRRVCPGKYYAEASLFITVASLLHVFNIGPAYDDSGKPVTEVDSDVSHGLVTYPVRFHCMVEPRFPEAAALLRAAQPQ